MARNAADILQRNQVRTLSFGGAGLDFQRTCRVPLNRLNSLPAGLGSFPAYRVADFKNGVPEAWREDGFFFPMYPQEAMWINFSEDFRSNHPRAVVVGAGNINAISGKELVSLEQGGEKKNGKLQANSVESLDVLLEEKQNYLVVPPQPWLDGWKAEDGKVYQFVAAEMGSGETVEGQITGHEVFGGLQFFVYEPKDDADTRNIIRRPQEYITEGGWDGNHHTFGILDDLIGSPMIKHPLGGCVRKPSYGMQCFGMESSQQSLVGFNGGVRASCGGIVADPHSHRRSSYRSIDRGVAREVTSMGLGKGGAISQKIYPDPYGLKVWKPQPQTIGVVYMVSSADFRQITGHDTPKTPVTFEKYKELGLPWFELHDTHLEDSQGSKVFETLKPVTSGKKKKPHEALEDAFEDEEELVHPPHLLDKKIFFYK